MKLDKIGGNLPILEVSILALFPLRTWESVLNFIRNYLCRSPITNSPHSLQQRDGSFLPCSLVSGAVST